MKLLLASLLLLSLYLCCTNGNTMNKITNLPGYSGPNLTMYSGYITVDSTLGKNIFYWFIESENDPSTDPLLIWFQGGPGCSGLGGLLSENGPLRPATDGSGGLIYNNLGWTQFANMLFLEQPAGVGYSYFTNPAGNNTNDTITAQNNYAFVTGWLQMFPQYQNRDTWLTGESYGGVYLPLLSQQILQNTNNQSGQQLRKQFQGFMLGNPVVCWEALLDHDLQTYIFYWHGLVSYDTFVNWTSQCSYANQSSDICREIYNQVLTEVGPIDQELRRSYALDAPSSGDFASLDPDDLYQDFCTGNGTLQFSQDDPQTGCPNEVGLLIETYLNRADVRSALAVSSNAPSQWVECQTINYDVDFTAGTPFSIYPELFAAEPKLKLLVYSGDVDVGTCPPPGTQGCLAGLNQTRTKTWGPWHVNYETAGYWEQYESYTYATIKGAGHEAPQYQPLITFNMAYRFLTTQSLNVPNSESSTRAEIPEEPERQTQGSVLREMIGKKIQEKNYKF